MYGTAMGDTKILDTCRLQSLEGNGLCRNLVVCHSAECETYYCSPIWL